ncbi:MAG: sugar ABC transporter ATP-binding protein [Hyphomicrobiales bacterium]|nr:sugar ABC transporter ATP-binding protein [Hyphomicrobiales bacterium]
MSSSKTPLVEMRDISKQFPGVKALDGVDFTLESGEVHVLFGENGAGKSTLISILSGVYPPSAGIVKISGDEVDFRSVHDATDAGIGTVFQEFSLVPTLTVFENIYLGSELSRGLFIDRSAMVLGAQKLFEDLGFEINVRQRVSKLSRAEQQMVEIAKAFHFKADVLILDEPTASLTERETEKLFSFIRNARENGVGVIYISHRIHEFEQIADRITVLRDGQLIGTVVAKGISEAQLIEMMTGRSIGEVYPKIDRKKDGEIVLSLTNVHAWGVNGVSLDVRAGEVLGIAGLVGSAKSRVWRSVIGLQPVKSGTVTLKGVDVTNAKTRDLIKRGLFYLPPDRKNEGLQLSASSRENLNLSILNRSEIVSRIGLLSPDKKKQLADEIGERVGLSKTYFDRTVSKLSGGNQQKVLFGKGFGEERDIYIFDEPTVGVDMGTRAALYRLMKEITESGKAVVVISSDLPEVMNLAHRLLVFSNGKIAAELTGKDVTEENVLKYFFAELRATA